jgi:hypothetical protein
VHCRSSFVGKGVQLLSLLNTWWWMQHELITASTGSARYVKIFIFTFSTGRFVH